MRLFLLLAVSVSAQTPAVKKMLGLFNELTQAQQSKKKVRFQLTESEVNDYLRHAATVNPRPGLESMTVKFFAGNYISTLTVVDFDMVEKTRPGTVPALLKPVLNGKKEIWVDIRLNAANGTGTFTVEKAYFQSIRLPAFMVEKMINTIGARQREKFDTSKPVPLPFGLQRITTADKTVAGEN
ncbi:MAG: hypothetical protein FJW30_00680 [Acidobacteria bacterium]|nr:hypothetical protein [Acidobacteriota bacterium]